MMRVVGEEGTSLEDYIIYLKADLLDFVYVQQNSFDPVDDAVDPERQEYTYNILLDILTAKLDFAGKEEARTWFNRVRQNFLDYNSKEWKSEEFEKLVSTIFQLLAEKKIGVEADAEGIL
jgi:V/A-type H+-transporting ATPase subunit A